MPDDQAASPTQARAAQLEAERKADSDRSKQRLRQVLFTGLAVVVIIGLAGFGLWWVNVGSRSVSTDDAYVGADVAQVTPQIDGTVTVVNVADTQAVKRGDVLVKLDTGTVQLKADQAAAQYAQAIRRIRQQTALGLAAVADVGARDADIPRAQAQVASAQADLDKAKVDLDRRQALSASGAVSGDELTVAKRAFANAEAALAGAKAGLAQSQAARTAAQGQSAAQTALTEGTSVENNPEVLAARSARDQALIDLDHATLRAPIDGVIARRQVQVGQRVAIGTALMTVVPVNQVYVDANFKEVQLRKVRPGQHVKLTADLYGGSIKYDGVVRDLAGGTGSAFSLIPAQNASGNWIKVVQRVPVRIDLDPADLQTHPLRIGLSMKAEINTDQG